MTYTTSWLFKLLAFFAMITMAISCKKKDSDSIKLQSDELVGAFFVDSFAIEPASIKVDSTYSSDRFVSRHLVGSLQSTHFGEQVAASYTQIKIPFQDFAFPAGAVYKSAELFLYANYFYGNTDKPVDILLYELQGDLFTKSNDSYRDYYAFETTDIGAFYNAFSYDPSIDSLRVTISDVLGQKIFSAGAGGFSSQQNFNNYLKGISLQPASGGEGIVGFDNERSFIRISYNDSLSQDFYLNTDVTSYNALHADRSGTPLAGLTNEEIVSSDDLGNTMYIQGGERIDGYVSFPDADQFLYNSKRGIYRAELEVIPDEWEFDIINTTRTWELLLQMKITSPEEGVYTFSEFQTSNERFLYDITAYAQAVAAGNHHFEGARLYMAHINSLKARVVCGNGVDGITVTNPAEKIRLKVYYTDF